MLKTLVCLKSLVFFSLAYLHTHAILAPKLKSSMDMESFLVLWLSTAASQTI